jgi:hypothetical protein
MNYKAYHLTLYKRVVYYPFAGIQNGFAEHKTITQKTKKTGIKVSVSLKISLLTKLKINGLFAIYKKLTVIVQIYFYIYAKLK